MTKSGEWMFLAREVFFLDESIAAESYPEDGSRSWFTVVNQVYRSAGYLIEFDLGDVCDFSHGRVLTKEALLREAFCLGEL